MFIPVRRSDGAVRSTMAVVRFLLKDYHPRDFSVRAWDGSVWEAEAGCPERFSMVLRHPGAARRMFLTPSERGLGEAYIYDDFDIEGSLECALPMAEHLFRLHPGPLDRLRLVSLLLSLPSRLRTMSGRKPAALKGTVHSLERDHDAVTYHYNTSNSFFCLFLGSDMAYSCAYFSSSDQDLDCAQGRKHEYVCRKLRLKAGERLLDIGCGWGGLVRYAVKNFDVTAVGVTLSEPQAHLANERIRKEGLADRCKVEVRDYRRIEASASYDKIASIGMVEHVGEAKLPEYFGQVWRLLRPGGLFLNHGIAHQRLTSRGSSFSEAFVFPDGDPVAIHVSTRAAELAGFEVRDVESLREHYALTLRHWVRALEAHHAEAVQATDESTYRVWRLFMSASAYQFVTGRYNVYQSLYAKVDRGNSGLPLTRAGWYEGL